MRISYSFGIDNLYRPPFKTMSIASGDCYDFSILAGAMFTNVEMDSAFTFYQNSNNIYHAMALVHIDKSDCASEKDIH